MDDPQKQEQPPAEAEPPRFYLHALGTAKQRKFAELLFELSSLRSVARRLEWRRVAFCTSLTGTPTRVLELYEGSGFDAVAQALRAVEEDPVLARVLGFSETREVELLRQLPYAPRPFPPTDVNPESHFLHAVLTVKSGVLEREPPSEEDPFTTRFRKVLPSFEAAGLTLMAAGRGLFPPFRVVHLWRFTSANTLNQVMQDLQHDTEYVWFLENTLQHQDLMHGARGFK